jgi:hypothetical protein
LLPELAGGDEARADLPGEYSSGSDPMSYESLDRLITEQKLRLEDARPQDGELLR